MDKTKPTAQQLALFASWGLTPLPTRLACATTIVFIQRGFPDQGKKPEAERIAFYREACERWTGQRVRIRSVGQEVVGTVAFVRGLAFREGAPRYVRQGSLLAVVTRDGMQGFHPRGINVLRLADDSSEIPDDPASDLPVDP